MIKHIDFYYKIAKEAELAEDEEGNPSECYLKLGFTLKKPITEEMVEIVRERAKNDGLQAAAEFLKVPVSFLTMVTEEEYLCEVEEEEQIYEDELY